MKVIKDSNDQYHSHDSISASGLKTIYKKSVYHLINQQFKETPAMALGTAVHQALLEPDDFYDIYHVIEKINKRTKAGKEEYEKQLNRHTHVITGKCELSLADEDFYKEQIEYLRF